MKQTFGSYLKNNPIFYLVMVGVVALLVLLYFNADQVWLWILAVLLIGFSVLGLVRNLNGKDGTW